MKNAATHNAYEGALARLEMNAATHPAERKALANVVRDYVDWLEGIANDRGDTLKSIAKDATKPARRWREVLVSFDAGSGRLRVRVATNDAPWLEDACGQYPGPRECDVPDGLPVLLLQPNPTQPNRIHGSGALFALARFSDHPDADAPATWHRRARIEACLEFRSDHGAEATFRIAELVTVDGPQGIFSRMAQSPEALAAIEADGPGKEPTPEPPAPNPLPDTDRAPARCPRCDAPDPKLHPAVQHEGEVQVCRHPFHGPPFDDAGKPALAPASVRPEDMTSPTALRAEVARLRQRKDEAFTERNRVVALLARLALERGWRAGRGTHEDKPGEAWDPEWRTLVQMDLPFGQVSWHAHDRDAHLFQELPVYPAAWDGHDTPEKYRRVLRTCERLDRIRVRTGAVHDTAPQSLRSIRQARALLWVRKTFGEAAATRDERARRLLEEAVELAQAEFVSRDTAHRIVDHVFGKPKGDPKQEVGGIGVTLLAYCEAAGISAEIEEEAELTRVLETDPDHFRARHNRKADAGIATHGIEITQQPVTVTFPTVDPNTLSHSLAERPNDAPPPPASETRPVWRQGRSVGRTLYVENQFVGCVDTPVLAAEIVAAMNGAPARAARPQPPKVVFKDATTEFAVLVKEVQATVDTWRRMLAKDSFRSIRDVADLFVPHIVRLSELVGAP